VAIQREVEVGKASAAGMEFKLRKNAHAVALIGKSTSLSYLVGLVS